MATQGSQANAKDDTLYYAERAGGAFSVLATDLSQHADNQTAGASWTYESSPASRFNVTEWTVEVEFDADNTDTGRFVQYGSSGASSTIALRYGNTAGTVDAIMATGGVATIVGQLALPGVSGTDRRFIFAWATEPNPLTTGASDAMRSELRAWNITTGAYAQTVVTHYARTAGTGDFIWWAVSTAGGSPFTGTPHMCRFSSRFLSATETNEDHVATTTAPTITGQTRIEHPIPEPANALTDPGQLVGPVLAHAAANVASMDLRTLSPLVAESYLERTSYAGAAFSGAPEHWLRVAPLADYTLLGAYLFVRRVPARVDRLKVRVALQQWRVGAGDDNRIHARVWSLNRPPLPTGDVTDHDQPLVARSTSDGYLEIDHGSGDAEGEWLDLGLCQVARNSAGRTWLVLGLWLEDVSAEALTDDNRIRVTGISIEPVLAAS